MTNDVAEEARVADQKFDIAQELSAGADDDIPEQFAPLIPNAWYAIADSVDVGRQLSGITALGEPLVFYRTEDGEPVVLDDRCAHRRFSLSKSRLVGDTIECGYHGYTYDRTGACTWAPTLNNRPRFGVRRFPTAEVGPWLWVWMGDPELADPAAVPYPKLDPAVQWHKITGYKHNPGNYMLLIENFLDLTHIHFLHGPEVSTREEANNVPRNNPDLPENSVGWDKKTKGVRSGIIAQVLGGDPDQIIDIHSRDTQFGPSLNYGMDIRYLPSGDTNDLYPMGFHVFHAITPQDARNTHQFFEINFSSPPVDGLEAFRDFTRDHIFQQDVDAIGMIQKTIESDHRTGRLEVGTIVDRFGVQMRKVLREMSRK